MGNPLSSAIRGVHTVNNELGIVFLFALSSKNPTCVSESSFASASVNILAARTYSFELMQGIGC